MSSEVRQLVLASTSRYRAELLSRIVERFDQVAPNVEESRQPDESCIDMATRLAERKAVDVSKRRVRVLVIGCDQVADLDGVALGKPGTRDMARNQLLACSGRTVTFRTAVCVVDGVTGNRYADADMTRVVFRTLDDHAIDRYLDRDQPFDCAGSFRVESAGIALLARVDSTDPTALIGLPLIIVCRLLRLAGLAIP
ncbi:MAG: Maf family nucleotide pyrophosphatase [Dokdonella sp.]